MIDARTAGPEPALHAATLLARTRLTQVECAARLGINERTLRYYVAGRTMPYALRVTFERLAAERVKSQYSDQLRADLQRVRDAACRAEFKAPYRCETCGTDWWCPQGTCPRCKPL